jgi:hypothetical protein
MQILKVKTQADFDVAIVKEGTLLVFPEQQQDGSFTWKYKDHLGNTGSFGATSDSGSSGIICSAGTGVAVGKLAYLVDDGGTLTCQLADKSSRAADGYVMAVAGTDAIVANNGICEIANAIAPDSELFLGGTGNVTDSPPTASGEIVQKVGRVINAETILFNIQPGRIIV